jgi:hypothetical protein
MNKSFRYALLSLSLYALSAVTAQGQEKLRSCDELAALQQTNPQAGSYYEKQFCDTVRQIKEAKNGNLAAGIQPNPKAGLSLRRHFYFFVFALVGKSGRADYIVEAEEARTDKQVGATDANAGSTSLTTKGSVPSILGFAVENGALTKTTSGTTITFRGNPVGIIKALGKTDFIQSYDEEANDRATHLLRKFSFSLSFDANRGSMPGTFTGDLQQVSSYSFRYDIINKRDPRNQEYKKDWDAFLTGAGQPLADQLQTSLVGLTNLGQNPPVAGWKDASLEEWYEKADQALSNAAIADVEATFKEMLSQVPLGKLSLDTKNEISKLDLRFKAYLQTREAILEKVSKASILTFEYTSNRQINAPNLSNFKLIAETGFGRRVDLTTNASFTIFNTIPGGSNLNRVRDFSISTQIDVRTGQLGGLGMLILSLSGKYARLMEDATVPDSGTPMTNTKGDIVLGQLKVTVPVKGTGVKIPISLTIANRTELIKESDVRGNIGITFDLDSIFARLKP